MAGKQDKKSVLHATEAKYTYVHVLGEKLKYPEE